MGRIFVHCCALLFVTVGAFAEVNPLLARDPQWLALLHMAPDGVSRIDDARFFFALDGATNPEAELVATLQKFNEDAANICRFPARFSWLRENLVELQQLSMPPCEEFATWYNAISPKTVTLILASSFINNPASAFGHTFLRFDQKQATPLLSYAANYAAETGGENALLYAFKGIFGGYNGFFSIAHYYKKVLLYSELENRDIWEYPLTLDKNEVERMVQHLWELRGIAVSYYYFDENCSYQLLSLFDVARPSLKLIESSGAWVIPVDTVRAAAPIIAGRIFRPSSATTLKHRVDRATDEQVARAKHLADVNVSSTESNSAVELDLAYELLTYEKIKQRAESAELNERSWKLLTARSKIASTPADSAVPAPAVSPELGHKTGKLKVGVGRIRDHWTSEFTIRPAFHATEDYNPGYQLGAQITFFELALRIEEQEGVAIDHFTALDITSLTPRDRLFKPLSWTVRTGMKRTQTERHEDVASAYLGGGAGVSYEVPPSKLLSGGIVYGLVDSELRANTKSNPKWNIGLGPRVGASLMFTDDAAIVPEVIYHRFGGDNSIESKVTARYNVNADFALTTAISYVDEFSNSYTKSLLGIEYFFTP